MVEADGAAHVSKAYPLNDAPPMLAGDAAAGATCWGAVAAAALAFAGDPAGVVVTGVAGVGDDTAEARTRSTDELLAPQDASTSTPAATS